MRFLVFEENVPKLASTGGHVATLAMLDHLSTMGEVHLVNLVSDPSLSDTEKLMTGTEVTVVDISHSVAGNLVTKIKRVILSDPKMVQEVDWARLLKSIAKEIALADRVILGWARFLKLLDFAEFPIAKSYYVADNVEYQLALSMASNYKSVWLCQRDSQRIKSFEARGVAKVHRASAFTPRDCLELSRISGREVDLVPPVLAPLDRPKQIREPFALYATNLSHPPNLDAIDWLLNEVWPQMPPQSKLVVTGAGDFEAYRVSHPNVNFAGFVSREELNDLYDRCSVVLNPTRTGSGIQIKMLEALAFDCPVVTTTFSNPFGDRLPHSDDPREFARLVTEQLEGTHNQRLNYLEFSNESTQKLASFLELV
ncbi:MAG: glycosyltransferase [Fimbriimonadaceae bacterium]